MTTKCMKASQQHYLKLSESHNVRRAVLDGVLALRTPRFFRFDRGKRGQMCTVAGATGWR